MQCLVKLFFVGFLMFGCASVQGAMSSDNDLGEIFRFRMGADFVMRPLDHDGQEIAFSPEALAALQALVMPAILQAMVQGVEQSVDGSDQLVNVLFQAQPEAIQTPEKISDFSSNNAPLPATILYTEQCPICFEAFGDGSDIAVFLCGHIFCVECANHSLSYQAKKCPNCRDEKTEKYRKISFWSDSLKKN
ncbi:hypothetical protein K2X40_02285 [Candidatus Babeliales bacterium]|nr:hypothetical protein [Candidatus Babeliales bacterium]